MLAQRAEGLFAAEDLFYPFPNVAQCLYWQDEGLCPRGDPCVLLAGRPLCGIPINTGPIQHGGLFERRKQPLCNYGVDNRMGQTKLCDAVDRDPIPLVVGQRGLRSRAMEQ